MKTRERGIQAGGRADVDNAAGALADHVFAEDLAGQHDALEIDGEDAVQLLLRNLEEGGGGVDSGPVDQDVHPAQPGENFAQQSGQAALGNHVAREEVRFAAARGDVVVARLCLGGVAAHQRDRRAGFGEGFGDRAAQLARAADDHGDLAVEGK